MKGSMKLASKIMFFIVITSLLLLAGCNNQEETNQRESQNASDHQNSQEIEPSVETTTVVFQNVNLITMTEDKVLENYSVVIKEGIIAEIGEFQTVNIPEDALIIEGEGKYLMPGLVDMHVHLWRYGGEDTLYLVNGITSVQNMWGNPGLLNTRKFNDRRLGPRIFTTGPIMDGPLPIWPGSKVLETPEVARKAVIAVQEEGYDAVKVYEKLSLEVYEEIMKTAEEIGIKVVGHVPREVGIRKALELGQDSIEHLSGYTLENIENEAELTAENNVWNTPTLALFNIFKEENEIEGLEYIDPRQIETWRRRKPDGGYEYLEIRQNFVRIIHEKGGKLLAGTDANNPFVVPGFSLHNELEYLADAGLTPYEVLKTATYNPAEFLGQLDKLGTVEVGKEADLILLSENPLEDIKNTRSVEGTMARGVWLTHESLQRELDKLKRSN
ncbi:amidohydrolase family protein [Alkaliphilus peptidifermentans]|uniref:Imidazolonepropionase n=1 Tax=Alkaliphilus peptidifermentans DSM 18978 TaxID=1120976 RepID=A0A1G5L4B8_9FIRM|nr:amidohydrolase family protein [Alkaliphilus peptidifermentans]SCZ07735.1 Imidazolonepropionase [Alkaliphilus peptidifermentans DSM 18978]